MSRCEELENELEQLKCENCTEYDLVRLERWMRNKLSISRLKNKSGNSVRYQHEAIRGDCMFTIHRKHKGKREFIWKKDFLIYLHPRLVEIIQYMRKEGHCEE